jgi:hypothetical protein
MNIDSSVTKIAIGSGAGQPGQASRVSQVGQHAQGTRPGPACHPGCLKNQPLPVRIGGDGQRPQLSAHDTLGRSLSELTRGGSARTNEAEAQPGRPRA